VPLKRGDITTVNSTRWCTYSDWVELGGHQSGTFVHPGELALIINREHDDYLIIITPSTTRPLLINSKYLNPTP
jgi:hypothetical protein